MEMHNIHSATRRFLNAALLLLGLIVLFILVYTGYVFLQSPEAIRQPKLEHAHFRMQLLINGKAEDFSSDAYQAAYKPQQCSDELAKEPIHFHDKKDQFVHIHWKHITGGMVLKYYGWNRINGLAEALGYRFDGVQNFQPVLLYGHSLPSFPQDANLYVYSGDESHFEKHDVNDFLFQDLETFFGKKSNIQPEESASWFDFLSSKAVAHGDEVHVPAKTSEELSRINNLLGNVVIFAQKDEPLENEIRMRFARLVPLFASTCGG